ncbi:MAG TPA: hypothetical protein VKQ32_00180 [Polyangia bacterium]|nr:hypothetical protein [Polyangia bacterium]
MIAKRGNKASRRNADGINPRLVPHGLHRRSDDGTAFMPDPEDGPARIGDDLAENLAEDYVQAATQGMEVEEDHDQIVPEEIGGPFVETTAAEEFAQGIDEANPEDASREPLPRPVAGLVLAAPEEDEID